MKPFHIKRATDLVGIDSKFNRYKLWRATHVYVGATGTGRSPQAAMDEAARNAQRFLSDGLTRNN